MKHVIRYGRITVGVLLLLAVMTYMAIPMLPAKADPADAFHSEWVKVRATADEDAATFAAAYDLTLEGNFANKGSSAYQISPRAGLSNRWMFSFCAKNYDVDDDNTIDNDFSFTLIGWAKDNGMLQVIAEGDCVLGTQGVIVYPDTGNAFSALVDESAVDYTHSSETFGETDVGIGVVAGMMAYITSDDEAKLTSGYYAVTSRTDDTIVFTGITSSANTTARIQMNPAFWADTISLDEITKWTSTIDGAAASSGNKGVLEVINAEGTISEGEVAAIVVDLSGIEWIQWVIYDATPAQTTEAGDVTVFGRKF